MAVKIAGIIVLGLSFIGLFTWLRWYITRCDEAEWKKAEQKRMQHRDDNDFIIKVFQEVCQDQTQYIDQLHDVINAKDLEIAELQAKLNNLMDTASKCHIKDFNNAQEEQA